MMAALQDYKYPLLCALLFHVVLFCLFLHGYFADATDMGNKQVKRIQAYVAYYEVANKRYKAKSIKTVRYQDNGKHVITKKNRSKVDSSKAIAKNTSVQTKGRRKPLLMLLHNAIMHNKITPENAQVLGIKGNVVVSFYLRKSGLISNVKVLKSSSYAILDQAAVKSILGINPFFKAKQYLKHSQKFVITIQYN